MSTLFLLRKSSASPSSKRVTLAALRSLVNHHGSTLSSPANEHVISRNGIPGTEFHFSTNIKHPSNPFECINAGFGGITRNFHAGTGAGSQLNFRASTQLQAEYAVADLPDEPNGASDEGLDISKLGISKEIVSALAGRGITKLFPIQRAVLEPAMQGRDMIGRARTGTGKTLAFGIPILDKIIRFNAKHGQGRNPLALVLAPTRELARQVEKEFCESAPVLDSLCVYGGTPISRQMSTLDHGVDVVVGTPGRIIDLIKRGALNLSQIQFVVLDEADQMLNVGFADDVETILKNLPTDRQTMMFSATMPNWIVRLTQKYLKNPLNIDLVGNSDQKLAEGISLFSIVSELHEKPAILGPLITEHAKGGKCIVFTQTKRDADRLAYAMAKNFRVEALHGDISQQQRERTLSGFRNGHFNTLVATDVAARGLDVPNVDLVIHYELPNNSEIFVHRSGRTGRAGKKGNAILIYSSHQRRDVKGIEREVGCTFTELPSIAVEGGSRDMFSDLGTRGSRFGSFGDNSRGRTGNYGSFGSGGRNGYSGSSYGRSGFGDSSARSGNFGSRRSSSFGDSVDSDSSFGFGKFGSNRSSSGESSHTPSRFGDFGQSSGRRSF